MTLLKKQAVNFLEEICGINQPASVIPTKEVNEPMKNILYAAYAP